jgi:tetratricopeptide (TPR) repeat protein
MAQVPEGADHAQALLGKGRALLGLGKFDDADQCGVDALSKVKEGQLHARLLLLQGDIAMARGDALEAAGDHANALVTWKKAAGDYVVVSQIFVDPAITPEALYKAALVLDKLGEKDKADVMRKALENKYPNYKPKDEIKKADAVKEEK